MRRRFSVRLNVSTEAGQLRSRWPPQTVHVSLVDPHRRIALRVTDSQTSALFMRMRILSVALALWWTLIVNASADGNTGRIYGRVLIAGSNQPVCPISVTLTSSHEPPQRTTTSGAGYFRFLSAVPGRVRVVVGRSRAVRDVMVSANVANDELLVRPIVLPMLRTLNHVTTRQYELGRRICGKGASYYSDCVFSDYEDH